MKRLVVLTIAFLCPTIFFAAERPEISENLKKALEEGTKYFAKIIEKKKLNETLPYVGELLREMQEKTKYHDKENFFRLLKNAQLETDPTHYALYVESTHPLYRILWKAKGIADLELQRPICAITDDNRSADCMLRQIKESIKLKFCKNDLRDCFINEFGTHIERFDGGKCFILTSGRFCCDKTAGFTPDGYKMYEVPLTLLPVTDPRTALYVKTYYQKACVDYMRPAGRTFEIVYDANKKDRATVPWQGDF